MLTDDRQQGLVDRDHGQRPSILGIGERLADRHLAAPETAMISPRPASSASTLVGHLG